MEVDDEAQEILNGMGPAKTAHRYRKEYDAFMQWKNEKYPNAGNTIVSENHLLVYFNFLTKVKKIGPSSLQPKFSMLSGEILHRHRIDIKGYHMVQSYINKQMAGFQPKQSNTFTEEQVRRFLEKADDKFYLAHKVLF